MEYGFVKTAAVSPKIRVADPVYNGTEIIRLMKETWEKGPRSSRRFSSFGTTVNAHRTPVNPAVLEKDLNSIATSRAPGIS